MTRRLLISYVSITVLVLILLEVPLGFAFARAERRRLETDLQHDAFALAIRAEESLEQSDVAEQRRTLRRIAEEYQEDQGGRVIFVDVQGRLLADSDPPQLDGSRPRDAARDFSSRPEIRRALRGRDVTGDRYSRTLGTDLLYVAVPVASGSSIHGAVRITYPLSFVNERIRDSWLVLAAVGGIIVIVIFLVCIALARSLTRPLADLERGAEAMGLGELDKRVDVPAGPREMRSLARCFNSTAARLEQLVGAQQAFVADASHQLRTPLAALRLRLENLADDIEPEGEEDLSGAVEEVNRLSLLVDGLLVLARAEQHGSKPESLDARSVLEGRRDAWSALAEERRVRIDVSGEDGRAFATPGRLEQVLDNLLNNALEVAPPDSTIDLVVESDADEVKIRVADAGPGMPPEQRARAFDRFWRGEGDTSGFGLGLAIVRQLVVADSGTVELGESPSGGLEVVIALPRAQHP